MSLLRDDPVKSSGSSLKVDAATCHRMACRICPMAKAPNTYLKMPPSGAKHPKVLILGEAPGCVSGDTLIDTAFRDKSKLLDGVPIKDLVGKKGFYVYSYDIVEEKLKLGRVKRVWKTGRKKIYRVTYEWYYNCGKNRVVYSNSIKVTANHLFLLRNTSPKYDSLRGIASSTRYLSINGGLRVGHSIQHISRKIEGGRSYIYTLGMHRRPEATFLMEELLGRNIVHLQENVHHEDENSLNDSRNNLRVLTVAEHWRHHSTKSNVMHNSAHYRAHKKALACPDYRKNMSAKLKAHLSVPENYSKRVASIRAHSYKTSATVKKLYATPEYYLKYLLGRQKWLGWPDNEIKERFTERFPDEPYFGPNHRIVSIEPLGIEDVFDMEVEEYHNFAANGVFVHNSTEAEEGKQFVGDSGQILRACVPREFRDEIGFDNTIRCRPFKNATPQVFETECCRGFVTKYIEEAKPLAIFGFGDAPLRWVSGFSGITAWSGRRMPVRVGEHVCWYYAMLHPAYLLHIRKQGQARYNTMLHMFKLNMAKAFKDVSEGLPVPVVHTPLQAFKNIACITGSGEEILSGVEGWLNWANDQPDIGIDYETTALHPYNDDAKLLTVAIDNGSEGFAFPIEHSDAGFSVKEKSKLRQLLRNFLLRSTNRKWVHNLAFELEWTAVDLDDVSLLRAYGWQDTASQACIIDERRGKFSPGPFSLEFLVQQYFGFNLKKATDLDRSNLDATPLDVVLRYNGGDARYHCLLGLAQESVIKSEGLEEPYRLALRRVPTVVASQIKGVPLDNAETLRLRKKYRNRYRETEQKIRELPIIKRFEEVRGQQFKALSNKDVIYVLHNLLGLREVEINDKYSKNTDEVKLSADKKILDQIDHPIAKLLVELRESNKRLSTYIEPLNPDFRDSVVYDDGLLHPVFNTIFASTGRLSCVRKGSRVQVPGGTKAIEDVKIGDLVYAFDDDSKLVLRKVTGSWYRGNKKVVRLHWRGDGNHHYGSLDVTPDHRIRLIDGSYRPAGKLANTKFVVRNSNGDRWYTGTRVLAMHRGIKGGYNLIYATAHAACKEARFVFEKVNGWIPEHVHHIDENKLNDVPTNLKGMLHSEHTSYHTRKALSVPGEAARRLALISSEARARGIKNRKANAALRRNARFTKTQIESALIDGNGIVGACRILRCDGAVFKLVCEYYGIDYLGVIDGRRTRTTRPERRKNLHPYKGHNEYVVGPKYNHVITRVETLPGVHAVYDLEVEDCHNFIVNEICVHNCDRPNMQNFPKRGDESKEVRKQIIAPPGCVILAFDYGQIEARVIAMFTKDKVFCKALWENYDVHMEWAEKLSRAYPERVGGKKNFTDKKVMKSFRTDIKNQWTFPLFFGARMESAANYLNIPISVITPLYDEFWETFSGVKSWQEEVQEFYQKHGYVECLTGRRRRGPLSLNQIINTPVQGTAAEIVMDAMSRLSEMQDWELQPEINIHDDLTFCRVPVKKVDIIAEKIIDAMIHVPFDWVNVPISIEMSIGDNWLDMVDCGTFASNTWTSGQ